MASPSRMYGGSIFSSISLMPPRPLSTRSTRSCDSTWKAMETFAYSARPEGDSSMILMVIGCFDVNSLLLPLPAVVPLVERAQMVDLAGVEGVVVDQGGDDPARAARAAPVHASRLQ